MFYLSTRKLLATKLYWVRGFWYQVFISFKIKQSDCVLLKWFGLALWKALVSFRHDLAGSPGLSATAHRHQVYFGIVSQAGWSLVWSPLVALDQHHLSRLWTRLACELLRHLALPLVHQLFPVRTLFPFYHDLVFISALQILWWEAPEIHKTSSTSSLHWCGAWDDMWGGNSSSSWGKETIGILEYWNSYDTKKTGKWLLSLT